MSHYDDFFVAVGELLCHLNDLSLSFLAGCAIWMAVQALWHMATVAGEIFGMLLWILAWTVTHAA